MRAALGWRVQALNYVNQRQFQRFAAKSRSHVMVGGSLGSQLIARAKTQIEQGWIGIALSVER